MAYLVLVLLLVCSALMSSSETALFGLSKHQLYQFSRSTHPLQRLTATLMRDPRRVLLTILMVNTTVNVLIFASSYVLSGRLSRTHPLLASLWGLITVICVIVVSEVLAKTLAISIAPTLAPVLAPLIRMLLWVTTPVRLVLEHGLVVPLSRLLSGGTHPRPGILTAEELGTLVDLGKDQAIIAADENDMLQEVMALSQVKIRTIMVPRVAAVVYDLDDSRDRLAELVAQRHRVIPVYRSDVDHLLGVLHVRDWYLNPGGDIEALLRPVHYVPEQMTADRLLTHFRQSGTHLAIVVDEYGGMAGLVTIKDVVHQVVGGLPTPGSTEDAVQPLGGRLFRMAGTLRVQTWQQAFGLSQLDPRITTLGGLVVANCGRLPRAGETLRIGRAQLVVEQVDGARVAWVRVELPGDPA